MKRYYAMLVALVFAAACTDDAVDPGEDSGIRENNTTPDLGMDATVQPDTSVEVDLGEKDSGMTACSRTAPAADRTRYMVVSRPYAPDRMPRNLYEVLTVAEDGTPSRTMTTFEMGGRQMEGSIVFTPDGEVGLTTHEDGTIGAFRLDENGVPTVIESALAGDYYATSMVMHPSGEFAYMIRVGFRNVEGAIYRVDIDCETGALTYSGLVAPAKLARHMNFLTDGRALLAATDVLADENPNDLHMLDVLQDGGLTRLTSASAFPDDEAIVSALAVTHDERFAILADNSAFSGVGNRLAVVSINGDALTAVQTIDELEDPSALITSPFDNAVISVAAQGDRIRIYDYDPEAAEPLTYRDEITAALPDYAATITRRRRLPDDPC